MYSYSTEPGKSPVGKKKNNPRRRFCNPSPQFINCTHGFLNCSLGLTIRAHGLINRTHEFLIRTLRFVNRALSFCNLYPQIHKPCPRFPYSRICGSSPRVCRMIQPGLLFRCRMHCFTFKKNKITQTQSYRPIIIKHS